MILACLGARQARSFVGQVRARRARSIEYLEGICRTRQIQRATRQNGNNKKMDDIHGEKTKIPSIIQ